MTICPHDFVTADISRAIQFAELFAKGIPPVAGGALEQADIFVAASRFIWREESFWRAKLKIF